MNNFGEQATREDHLVTCKLRALGYLKPGKYYSLQNAVSSMTSDLSKHPETKEAGEALGMIGLMAAMSGVESEVRGFIEGF